MADFEGSNAYGKKGKKGEEEAVKHSLERKKQGLAATWQPKKKNIM